ncbi:MAG: HNH endonuclease family protein [Actinomycetota bacterium]|nr:HNH endonuclease family protein [Actinomycetota bacterium]
MKRAPSLQDHRTTSATWIKGAIAAAVILATTACGGSISATQQPPSDVKPDGTIGATAAPGTGQGFSRAEALAAKNLLASLPVKGRAPKTGYDRTEFGPAWADTDNNGCDTRNDILARDLTARTTKPGTRNCVILTGRLADPYTATTISFTRGASTSSEVQIDHVVALSDAWQKGAQQLTKARRTAFANDPRNLLAVSGPANQKKGDGDAATWLPGNKAFRCAYVARQIWVKAAYKLWVTRAEHTTMTSVLVTCGATG